MLGEKTPFRINTMQKCYNCLRLKMHQARQMRASRLRPAPSYLNRLAFVGLVSYLAVWISVCQAQPLTWITSQTEALALAQSQGKMILLIAGRGDCAECDYMHNVACESSDPPVKALIQEAYVPWFCNIDLSEEWRPYAAGLPSFPLPLICTINPTNSAGYMDRSVSIQPPKTFYSRLLRLASIQFTNAHFNGLSLSNGVARIEVSQLTFGATHYLERSLDLQQPDGWIPATNFVSLSRTNSLIDPLDNGWKRVFYRIKSVP
jgi:hypothetical protein